MKKQVALSSFALLACLASSASAREAVRDENTKDEMVADATEDAGPSSEEIEVLRTDVSVADAVEYERVTLQPFWTMSPVLRVKFCRKEKPDSCTPAVGSASLTCTMVKQHFSEALEKLSLSCVDVN